MAVRNRKRVRTPFQIDREKLARATALEPQRNRKGLQGGKDSAKSHKLMPSQGETAEASKLGAKD
jgi:hypothetical protein